MLECVCEWYANANVVSLWAQVCANECVCVCEVSWNAFECVFKRDRQRALTRQALMHVFIRAWGEAERTGQ